MEVNEGIPRKDESYIQRQPEPSGKSELTASLEQIDSKIIARYINGKFDGPLFLHGQQLLKEGFDGKGDYQWLPDLSHRELREKIDPTGQFSALDGIVRDGVHHHQDLELWNTLASSHVLGYLIDKSKPHESTLVLIYPYEFYDRVGRPALTATACLKLPTESLKQLLGIITENPDALEEFYQIATAGLDPSVKRYKSSQLAIVDLDTFMPLDKFQLPGIGPENLYQALRPYSNRLNPQGLTLLQYSSLHGSIDKAEAEAEAARQEAFRQKAAQKQQELEKAGEIFEKVDPSKPKEIPEPIDNPSGLTPDAPLTKLINAGIRLFRPKPK